ncbi:hypothetical protein IZU94_17940 [Legionella sp. 27fs60]|nr:hypothetical protein [Legionella bononiensis]MBL7564360.1 hypothetical protein [Legionella bononiensis]
MESKIRNVIILCSVIASFHVQAICVKNITHFSLYYEIENRNTQSPVPKVKFHSGIVNSNEKKCHSHTDEPGDEWKIYRFDLVKIFKVEENGEKVLACYKLVEGIANRLDVRFHKRDNSWWCLDKDDYED